MKHGGNTPATPAPETADSGEQKPTRRSRKPKEEEPPAPNPEDVEDAERAAAGDPDGTWTPGGGEADDSDPVEQTEPKDLPKCLMGNGSSSSSTIARVKSLFVQILMPATVATRKAA